MKKIAVLGLACIMLISALPATAGGWDDRHRHNSHGWGSRHDRHDRHDHHRHHGHHRHNNAWAWGAAGLILGGALLAQQATPAPVVVQPPRPAGQWWYYCDSYRAYYPEVQTCPEPWRTIPAW